MVSPDFETFQRLANGATLVPVAKALPSDLLTPVGAYLAIAQKEPDAFLLESVEGGEKIGRYTYLGAGPYLVVSAYGDRITLRRGRKTERIQGEPFAAVKRLLAEHRMVAVPGLPPFTAGAVGFFSYDAVRRLEKLPSRAKDDLKLPDAVLMFFDRVLVFDHVRQLVYVVAVADVSKDPPAKAYARAQKAIVELEAKIRRGAPKSALKTGPSKRGGLKLKTATDPGKYMKGVQRIKEYIRAGDAFQVVLSQRMEFEPGVEPFAIYRALRRVNPSPYMFFLRMGDLHVLGSSPEMLVKATRDGSGTRLEYRPIAGTRPRSADDAEDRRLEAELRADDKERAEHVMLVDLGRNDLGRVSEAGTVKVRDLMTVERYSHVMHLVSSLESRLRKDVSPLDALASCFPAGTLSGAPKVRAMEIIEELEPVRRGVYGGTVLYADFAGNLNSCIAIRTMVMKGKKAWVQAGAGIVADSVPEREHEECLNKARAVVRAVEVARATGN